MMNNRLAIGGLALMSVFLPSSHAQWIQTNFSGGAPASLLSSGSNLIVGTIGAGIFISSNNGAEWRPINSGLANPIVWTLAATANGPGVTLFAGTNSGVCRSTDNGGSWLMALPTTSSIVRSLLVSGTDVFAGIENGGVYRSTDDGTSWTAVNAGLDPFVWALAVSPVGTPGVSIFAGVSGSGVFLSTNNGAHWSAISSGLTNLYVSALVATYDGAGGMNLFAGTDSPPGNPNAVFMSTDVGANWSSVLPASGVSEFATRDSNIFVGTYGGGVRLSTNNGRNWRAVNTGLTNLGIEAIGITPTHLFAGISSNGSVWRRPLSEMLTSVETPATNLPECFTLEQNYPNPFNPTTTISFTIPRLSFITLKVFDVLGREVATVVNEVKRPGRHEVPWDASKQPSGVYYYRLSAGSFSQTMKAVLIR